MAEKVQEAELCAAVALAKGVDNVELGQEIGGEGDEFVRGCSPPIRWSVQAIEQLSQLLIDVGGQTEEIPALGRLHGPRRSRPLIHILEEMAMDGPEVLNIEIAGGEWLSRAQSRHF